MCVLFALALTSTAHAQLLAGPQVGYDTESESAGVGVNGLIPLPISQTQTLFLNPGFSWYFVEGDVTLWTVDANVQYPFPMESSLVPFVGAGLGLQRWSVDVPETSVDVPGFGSFSTGGDVNSTDLIFNIQGGVQIDTGGPLTPHAGLTVSVGGTDRLEIGGGIRYAIGGR